MALRKLLARSLPAPPEQPPGLQELLEQAFEIQLLVPVRLFWNNLNALRPWWPVLLPLLAWIGWRTYRRERARYLSQHG
jgi:hypothetical protein